MTTAITELTFHSSALDREVTIREFFYEIMTALWKEKEQFSGKYTIGDSDWDGELIICLIKNKLVTGTIDEFDDPEGWDDDEVLKFVQENVIKPLFNIN